MNFTNIFKTSLFYGILLYQKTIPFVTIREYDNEINPEINHIMKSNFKKLHEINYETQNEFQTTALEKF